MSQNDNKCKLHLRIINESIPISNKKKNKRGRPRKNLTDNSIIVKTHTSQKKTHNQYDILPAPIISKQYIVQLKVKSGDLLQKQIFDPIQGISLQTTNNMHIEDYYTLVDQLELPLNHSIDLFNIPNLYSDVAIPVLPENIPAHLFNEIGMNEIDMDETIFPYSSQTSTRQTGRIMLPAFCQHGNWPETSSYACWNCDSFFDGTPIGIPERETNGKFYCYGNFCCFECAARYLADRDNVVDFWNQYSLLCILYQLTYKLPPNTKVPIAPQKEVLSKYGGCISYEQYHTLSQLDKTVAIYQLPMIPVLLQIEELSKSINIDKLIQKKKMVSDNNPLEQESKNHKKKRYVPLDSYQVQQAENNIRIKTNERLQHTYTLDDCFANK